MSKAKMGFGTFSDGYLTTDIVAPKSVYPTKESFIAECKAEYGENYADWSDKVKIENVVDAHCRYFPRGFEGWDQIGGCYSFTREGTGAFPVWRIELN
jgi:hypothetical protein